MIALFGPAGSGKSLQGQILADRYDMRWLSVGELLRERAKTDKKLAKTLLVGELVDDAYVTKMMGEAYNAIDESEGAIILDGYPRDKGQAEYLVQSGDIKKLQGVVLLQVEKEELWQRLAERGREDDAARETVEQRWRIYEQQLAEIIPILEANKVDIEEVDGMGEVDDVTDRLIDALEYWGLIESYEYGDEEPEHEASYGE